jgi:hypothetical protein
MKIFFSSYEIYFSTIFRIQIEADQEKIDVSIELVKILNEHVKRLLSKLDTDFLIDYFNNFDAYKDIEPHVKIVSNDTLRDIKVDKKSIDILDEIIIQNISKFVNSEIYNTNPKEFKDFINKIHPIKIPIKIPKKLLKRPKP